MSKAKRRPGHPLEQVTPKEPSDIARAAAPKTLTKKGLADPLATRPGLNDEDRELFRQATRLVTPLKVAERHYPHPARASHASVSQLAQRRQQAVGPSLNVPGSQLSDDYRHPATEDNNH